MTGRVQPERARILRPWYAVALVACVLAAAIAIWAVTTRPDVAVRVVSPTYEDVATTISTSGTVEPTDDFPARANFTGLVQAVYVHVGEKVHAGQMLIRMKDQYASARLERAKADLQTDQVNEENVLQNGSQEDRIGFQVDLAHAQVEQTQAANALKSMEEIAKNGSVTPAELDAARQRLSIANVNLASLKSRSTQRYSLTDMESWKDKVAADKANLAAEQVSWNNANIAAPIAGTVYLLPTQVYDFVPAGADLLHIADLSQVQIKADFDEADVPQLRTGMPVDVTWDGKPGQTWHGHLTAKPLAVSRAGDRNMGQCTITLDSDHSDLPLNTQVAVIATTAKHGHVLAIPREALHTRGANHFVYRVENGKLKWTPVQTGLINVMRAEITQGLAPRDTVAIYEGDDARPANNLRVTISK